jgi:hypothetical protein
LRHASARNVIECIFGVLKHRFRILLLAPEYGMATQVQIPTALSALHNFIRKYDSVETTIPNDDDEDWTVHGDNEQSTHDFLPEENDVDLRRDEIASIMWDDYQCLLCERGMERQNGDGDEDEDDSVFDELVGTDLFC